MQNRISYTVNKINDFYFLTSLDGTETIKVDDSHSKFSWCQQLEPNRIVNITAKGRWTSSADYNNVYGTLGNQTKSNGNQTKSPIEIKLTKLDDVSIDPSLFTQMETGTVFDKFMSSEGGFLPGTNIMAAGAPGIGKTTVLLDLLSRLQATGKKCLFISAEMNQIDMARYLKRFPNWGQLPIMFLSDYTDDCPKEAIEEVLKQGWDIVLTDSYTEVNDTVKEACNLSRGKVEKWFLNLMDSHNKGLTGTHTTFVTILQLSKGGTFVGSNKLKHMSTAMMQLDWDGSENSGRRYMEFSKNRIGEVNKKLYFSLENGVNFDEARFQRDLFNDEILEEERKALNGEEEAFDKLFGFDMDAVPEELQTQLEAIPSL